MTALQNLTARAFTAFLSLLAAVSAAPAQNLPVQVGQEYDAAVAALKGKGIDFREDKAGDGRTLTYRNTAQSVTLDFSMWPKDPGAPASAWQAVGPSGKHLVLTHIQDVAPGSDARRAWVRTFEKDGKRWAYLPEKAAAARPAAEQKQYPVVAFLQWPRESGSAPVTLLFQAARAPGTPPGAEATALEIFLENPYQPRRF